MLRPGVWILIGYLMGLLSGLYRAAILLPAAVILLFVMLYAVHQHTGDSLRRLGVVVFFFLLAAVQSQFVFAKQRQPVDAQERIVLEGTVESIPAGGQGSQVVCRIHGKRYKILLENTDSALVPGDRITISGLLKPLPLPMNPGEWNELIYDKAKGIEYHFQTQNVQKTGTSMIFRLRYWFTNSLWEQLLTLMPEEQAGAVQAILSGDRSVLDPDMKTAFQNAGIAHIIAISGLHVQIVSGILEYLLGKVLKRRQALLVTAGIMGFYCFLTGCAVSTLRAVLMLCFKVAAVLKGRKEERLNSLAFSALFLLLYRPVRVMDSGFQLSFAACLALEIGKRPWMRFFSVPRTIRRLLSPSVAVATFTAPVVLYHFHTICPYTIILNLLVIPLMSIVILMSVLAALFSLILRPVGLFLCGSVYYVLVFYQKLCEWTGKLPGSVLVLGQPSFLSICCFYTAYGFWIRHAGHPQNQKMAACAVTTAVLFCFTVWIHGHSAEMVLLSVGQGDAAVIRQSGKTFVVDAGPGYERVLKPYLQSRGITWIDGIFLSHSDQDHSQGVISLLEDPQFKVKTLYLPENLCFDWSGEIWQKAERTVYIKQGDEIRSGKLIFRCISPDPEFLYEDENSASMCLHLTTKNGTIYMSGDADMAAEHRILQEGGNLAAGILKAPHHGSRTSLSEELLQAVDPSLVFISCGRNNSYGHPHEETLERIQKQGAEYWISWQSGALLLQDGHINQYKEVFFTTWMQQARWIR